jgi:hypothetical protein
MSRRAEAAPGVDVERLDDDTPGHLEPAAEVVPHLDADLAQVFARLRAESAGDDGT